MRLAHCSDLHLLSHDGAGILKLANKRWIGAANLLTNRSRHYHVVAFEQMVEDMNAQGIEHVLCTGDVTNLALEQEFVFAKARFDKLAVGPEHVTVIPGNHDAYVAEGIGFFARIFDEYHRSDPGWTPSARPEAERGKGGDTTPSARPEAEREKDPRWPFVRIRGDLALVGITTSRATAWFTAYGKVGEVQLARLRKILTDDRLKGKARVIAIHHPPAGKAAMNRIRGLHDHEAFANVIAEAGCDLIVHGHEHRDMTEMLQGPNGPIPVRGIASGTYSPGLRPDHHISVTRGSHDKSRRTACYRIFDIDSGRITTDHLRVWRRGDSRFEAEDGTTQQSNYGT